MQENHEQASNSLKIASPRYLILLSLVAGIVFDLLFWKKIPGISVPIYILILLSAGILFTRNEDVKLSRGARWLLIPIIFFAVMSVLRGEAFTRFWNIFLSFAFLVLLSMTYANGKWWKYGIGDYIVRFFNLVGYMLSTIFRLDFRSKRKDEAQLPDQPSRKLAWSLLRGLLIAIPVVVIFTLLLSSADPIFAQKLKGIFSIFKIENLSELVFRLFLIFIIMYMAAGVFAYLVLKSDTKETGREIKPWLGFVESVVVLGSVNLLFLSFVIVQFQYFFGGEKNISINGFTFAEYARKGFGELVFTAIFSILLYLVLSAITKRQEGKQRSGYSALGIVLFVLISLILVSAFRRMVLYEEYYGFTSLRTYSHIFMIWLGILLGALVIMELTRKIQFFTLAFILFSVGFFGTLDVMNVDAFIAQKNIHLAQSGAELDVSYLSSLSTDAVPTMVKNYLSLQVSGDDLQYPLAAAIVCHAKNNDYYQEHENWQSFHSSNFIARQKWESLQDSSVLPEYTVLENDWGESYLWVNGEEYYCYSYFWD